MSKMIKQTLELTTEFQKEVVSRLMKDMYENESVDLHNARSREQNEPVFIVSDADISNIFMDVMKDVIEDFNRGVM